MKIKMLLLASLLSTSAEAADGVNLNVTGNIVASPCVFNAGNDNLDINLGDHQATNMATPGASTDPVSFNLTFTLCPAGTQSVTVLFTGTPDPVAGPEYYKNSGTATHVAIAMSEASSGTLKGSGSTITRAIGADRTVTLPMQAVVTSVDGRATPGSLSAVVVLTMQYN